MRQNGPNQAPRRKLIPNLLSSILRVVAESDRPLTQHEIVEAVSKCLDRSDEELKRQLCQPAWSEMSRCSKASLHPGTLLHRMTEIATTLLSTNRQVNRKMPSREVHNDKLECQTSLKIYKFAL
ncbi:uncharacterized protein LOC111594511 isoform X1 [Drosophila hydei]|uniref:Uncharacterized protein LOC111594511 isoform X1 n=1 Tax=Drosophila hydei TaxID=7224 RepID=A0A6J1LA77_DROHY|nr:uncharacterized protein LOC111594511 isoform X1 [Drosophila hydei]